MQQNRDQLSRASARILALESELEEIRAVPADKTHQVEAIPLNTLLIRAIC